MSQILVIEDNESDTAIMKFLLNQFGYQADFVSNAYDANDKLDQYSYKLILLDWHLPKMSGIDYLRQLKVNPNRKQIPVIMISGKNEVTDIKRALKEGIADYIVKPIDPMILNNKISLIFGKQDTWEVTKVPSSFNKKQGVLKENLTLTAISEVEIEFSSQAQLITNSIYNLNFDVLNELLIFDLKAKVISSNELTNSSLYLHKAKLLGLKEDALTKIRLLCKTFQTKSDVIQV